MSRWTVAVLAVVLSAGCSGDDDDGQAATTTTVEAGSLDTTTTFEDGVLEIAGVAVTRFADYEINPATGFTMVPPNWPTLSGVTLRSTVDPIDEFDVGAGVLAQEELGLARAGEVIEAGFRYSGTQEAELSAEGRVEGSGRVCSFEVRRGPIRGDGGILNVAIIVVGGEGIASFGLHLSAPVEDYPLGEVVGDVVEEICGSRPGST